MVWIPDDEKNFEDMYNRLDRIPACDGQTDRRTDGRIDRQTTCYGYASHGKNGLKQRTVNIKKNIVAAIKRWLASRHTTGVINTTDHQCYQKVATVALFTPENTVRKHSLQAVQRNVRHSTRNMRFDTVPYPNDIAIALFFMPVLSVDPKMYSPHDIHLSY